MEPALPALPELTLPSAATMVIVETNKITVLLNETDGPVFGTVALVV